MTPAMPADRNPADPSAPPQSPDPPARHSSVPTAEHPARPAGPAEHPPPDATDDAAPAPREAARTRDARSPKDMAVALLVLLIPMMLVIGLYRVFLDGDQPVVVDPGPVIADAQAAKTFPVAEPSGLDSDWRTVAATFRRAEDGATLRLGYVSPSGGGAQLVQSNVPSEQLLPRELAGGGRPEGVVSIDGRDWQRYPARSGERALVLLEPGRTVIAVGAVSEQELRELVDSLN